MRLPIASSVVFPALHSRYPQDNPKNLIHLKALPSFSGFDLAVCQFCPRMIHAAVGVEHSGDFNRPVHQRTPPVAI